MQSRNPSPGQFFRVSADSFSRALPISEAFHAGYVFCNTVIMVYFLSKRIITPYHLGLQFSKLQYDCVVAGSQNEVILLTDQSAFKDDSYTFIFLHNVLSIVVFGISNPPISQHICPYFYLALLQDHRKWTVLLIDQSAFAHTLWMNISIPSPSILAILVLYTPSWSSPLVYTSPEFKQGCVGAGSQN